MRDLKLSIVLAGGMIGLVMLWVTLAPETVTRAEMQSYVQVTATAHLKILRDDIAKVQWKLGEVSERLAAVETIVRRRE